MLSADAPGLLVGSEWLSSVANVSAALDPQSDTGISSSDGITSDNTPVLQVSAPQYAAGTIWAVASNQNGFTYIELDPTTGAATGRQFTNAWGNWQWACGSAVGDGRLYVAAPVPGTYGPSELRTYDLATFSLLSTIQLSGTNLPGGLAYMNGKLYVADSAGFQVVDPTTGAVLDTKVVLRSDWSWSGTAQSLAASPTENVLYAVNWYGALTKIDAATGTVLAEYAAFSSGGGVTGAAYNQGKLFVSEGNLLHTFDPATLQRLSTTALPSGAWMFVSLAGDGATKTFLRLYDNGSQIGSNYSADVSSIETPTLYGGPHDLVVKAYGPSGALLGSSAPVRVVVDTRLPTVSPIATLAIGSDTGISSTDGITSDTTPLLNVIPGSEGTIWTVSTTTTDGFMFTEVDTITGALLRGFTDPSLADYTAGFGAAIGDGVLYVSTARNQEYRLRTYSLTGALLNDAPLSNLVFGLAYLNGKLYGASGDLLEIDPQTGATLSRRMIYYPGGPWVGVGYNLAADSKSGVLYTTIDQRLVKINPDSSVPLSVTNLVNAPQYFDGLAFSVGKLIGSKLDGQLYYIDPSTAQVTSFRSLPQSLRVVYGMGGEGNDSPLYYRVFCDGVQVSGDYESAPQFQLPELSAGTHTLTIMSVDAAGNVSPGVAKFVHIDTAAPAQPEAPALDPASDTGLSSTDGITADATPLLTIRQVEGVSSIWQVSSLADGLLFVERDPATGDEITRFSDTTVQGSTWAIGAATGEGVIYVAGADGALRSLRTYSLSTRTLISSVPLERGVFGLAYLDGRLYGGDAGLMEIDPTTGAILSYQHVFVPGGQWVGTGAGLAADSVEGVLYSVTFYGQLVKIDPATASALAVIDNVDPERQINGLAFAGGSLVAITYQGQLLSIDPQTGQVTQIAQLSADNGYSHGLAGDGAPGSWPYFRVFSDGVQVSGDYETGEQFQMPQLSDGAHIITVAYVDPAGNVSAMSEPITLVIDTTPPHRPGGAALNSTSDTGVSTTDGITSDTTPLLNVPLENSLYYRVFSDGVQVSGDYESAEQFQMPELSDGIHIVTVKYVDAAGNVSLVGQPATLRILTATPSQPASATLDPSSNSGDTSDNLTNDNTPLLQIPAAPQASQTVRFIVQESDIPGQVGGTYVYTLNPKTHEVSGRTLLAVPSSGQWDWTHGAAIGDGMLYVVSAPNLSIYPHDTILSAYNLDSGALIYQTTLPQMPIDAAGLAYLGGKLYVCSYMLYSIDPVTGEILSSVTPHQSDQTGYVLIGNNLTGAEDLGRLFAIDWVGQFVNIDPATGEAITLQGYDRATAGISYANGELVSVTFDGLIRHIDPQTGALTETYQLPMSGLYSAMAGEGAITPGSEMYYRVFADGVQVSGDYESGNSFEMPQLADGEHLIEIAYIDAAGNVSTKSGPLNVRIDTTPPAVAQVVINDGSAQRSMVNQITVTFTERVLLAEGAIGLTMADGSEIPGTTVSCASADGQSYVLSFSGEAVLAGSLADGLYKLSIAGTSVRDLAANEQAQDFTYSFHRLFGDGAGDGSVSQADLQVFIDALSARYGQQNYAWYFDYDASGRISGSDMSEFIERFVDSLDA